MEAIFFAVVLFIAFVMLAGGFFYAMVKARWSRKAALVSSFTVVTFLLGLGALVVWWVRQLS